MTNLLARIERDLDEVDERVELLSSRLEYVAELAETLAPDDEQRDLKMQYLKAERARLVAELRLMLEAACKLEVTRDLALAGKID